MTSWELLGAIALHIWVIGPVIWITDEINRET